MTESYIFKSNTWSSSITLDKPKWETQNTFWVRKKGILRRSAPHRKTRQIPFID